MINISHVFNIKCGSAVEQSSPNQTIGGLIPVPPGCMAKCVCVCV